MNRRSMLFKAQTAFLSVSRCDCLASTQVKKTTWRKVWDVPGDVSCDPGAVGGWCRSGLGVRVQSKSKMILHTSETAVPVPLTRCTDSNLSMAAVVPRVLIIVDSLLWLRVFFFFFTKDPWG